MNRLVVLLFLLLSPGLLAQAPIPRDCMQQESHRQFDFWLGSWRVTDKAGKTVYGDNHITREERGCLLHEQWFSAGGGSGSSMNYYNPADGQWHQHWVDAGASVIHTAGGMDGDSMVMKGRIDYMNPVRSADFRARWTPLPDGRVRQFFEEKDAQGRWQTWFEGFYSPLAEAEAPPEIAELTIPSDGSRMPGLMYLASGAGPHPTVVLLHGFPGNEKNLDLAQAMRRAGFNVLFFHYRGAWGADGNYSVLLWDDVAAALDFLREPANRARYRVDTNQLSLLGHSLGAYTALAAGSRNPGLACVGAMSPANMGLWQPGFAAGDALAQRLSAYADSLYMLKGFDGQVMAGQLASVPARELDAREFGPGLRGKSVFMIVGDRDPVTPPDTMFQPIVEAYSGLEGLELESHVISGDHSFSSSRLELASLVLDWLRRDCRARAAAQ